VATPARLTQQKKDRFLELLRAGQPVTRAAEAAKLKRRTLYDWRKTDPEFAHAWEEAWEQGCDALEEVAIDRAIKGSDLLLIFMMKGRRPERYRDNVRHEVDARLTVSVEGARKELGQRLDLILEHRRQALPRGNGDGDAAA
jgi:hypothetical protein